MKPNEIRAEMARFGIKGKLIARECEVSGALVSMVIDGIRSNAQVQRVIAIHLNKPLAEVFPEAQ